MNEGEFPFVGPRSTIPKQIRRARKRDAEESGRSDGTELAGSATRLTPSRPLAPISTEQARLEWKNWFTQRGWQPFPYQEAAWDAFAGGESGLIISPTGNGKTFAALGGPLISLRAEGNLTRGSPLRVIYISPLKALVRDVEKAVQVPLRELGWDFPTETRTGDTSEKEKRRQREKLPPILFTTPESLALLVSQPDWKTRLGSIRAIILDEFHELLASKRGSLLELTLARLRAAAPQARTWAVSATISNPEVAAKTAAGIQAVSVEPRIIHGESPRATRVRSIFPQDTRNLPWFGHYGLRRVPEVAAELDLALTTLLFTNTRGQAERWYEALLTLHPEWEGKIGLHHGSLDRAERERVENAVKDGTLPFVVATSSLDLGVDFPTVQKVIQIGSVKGVARATQRAGRAFHRPDEDTELTVCPTHFMEYLEVAALRRALSKRQVEPRSPKEQPLDVLVQFALSSALGDGFEPETLLKEVQSAYSFRAVTRDQFDWVLSFVTTGGDSLKGYPQFRKIQKEADGLYRFATPKLARLHRFNIGTIVGDSSMQVRFLKGGTIGLIDEGFISKLKRGDLFSFAGKTLELILIKDMNAYVRAAKGKTKAPTVWGGHALPLGEALSDPIREILGEISEQTPNLPAELSALEKPLAIQRRESAIPKANETLVERLDTREGHHLFVYTWEGRAVNEGLGHLLAYRLSQASPNTIAVSANDHGFECLGVNPFPGDENVKSALQKTDDLGFEIEQSLNFTEMAKRSFREIARVAGLIQLGPPTERKSTRQLQISSSLLFDVFRTYEPNHPLLQEAFRDVRTSQLDLPRLSRLIRENFAK